MHTTGTLLNILSYHFCFCVSQEYSFCEVFAGLKPILKMSWSKGITFFVLVYLQHACWITAALESNETEILNWKTPEELRSKYPYYLSGYDKEGSPVYIVEVGKWDIRSAIEQGSEATDLLDKVFTQMFLRGRTDGNEADGSPGTTVIVDGEGFGLRQAGHVGVVQFLFRQIPKLEQILRTPGVKRVICINYNYIIRNLYDIGRPLLGASSNIFEVYGTNPEKWKPLLLKEIDADQLPEWYGGSKDHKPLKIYP